MANLYLDLTIFVQYMHTCVNAIFSVSRVEITDTGTQAFIKKQKKKKMFS